MNKKLFLWKLILVLVMVTLVTSCAPAAEPTAEPTSEDTQTQEVIELTMWDIPASEAYTIWWENYIDEFNSTHPNIKVNLEVFEMEAMRAKTLAAVASETAPEILYSQPYPEIREAVRDGILITLDDYINADSLDPLAREIVTVDGKVAGVPIMLAPSYIYYNKDQFAEAGVDPQQWANPNQPTWEEFLDAGDKLKAAGFPPIMLGGATLWGPLKWYWSFHHRYGGFQGLIDAVAGENGGSFESKPFINAGYLLQDLEKRGYFIDGYNAIGEDTMYSRWANGDGAMIYMGLWLLGSLADAPEDFEFGFFDFPSFSDGDQCCQQTTQGGVEAFWVPRTAEHPEAVGEFFKKYLEKETAIDYTENSGYLSPVAGVVPDNVGPESPMIDQVADLFRVASKGLFSWYDHNIPAAVNEIQFKNIQALLAGDMLPEEFSSLQEAAAITVRENIK